MKYFFVRLISGSLLKQIITFTALNALVLVLFHFLYSVLAPPVPSTTAGQDIGKWHVARLFIDSNSILDKTSGNSLGDWLLLISEAFGTILFSGLIVSIITAAIIRLVENIEKGRIHYQLKNHVVIIGYDNIVPSIISKFIGRDEYKGSKIVLQSCTPIEEIKNTLLTKLPEKVFKKRVILVHAPRQSVEELELLYTYQARNILIIGDRSQADHDAENINTFRELVAIHQKHKPKPTLGTDKNKLSIKLMVLFENEASYAALQLNDIKSEWKEYFDFSPFNFYKRWSNLLLTKAPYDENERLITYPNIDHDSIKADSENHVHLIIIGMNRMGTALAKEAAHIIHFPNFNEKTGKNRTDITFIDDHADTEMSFFKGRLPGYFMVAPELYADLTASDFVNWENLNGRPENHFLDVQFRFIKGRIESDYVRNWLQAALEDKEAITTIAICLHNPSQSFGMAMYLPEEVYTRGRNTTWQTVDENLVVNIFVRQETSGTLIKAFSDAAKTGNSNNQRYANLYSFGMVDKSFSLKFLTNHLAMAFNYVYDYYFANGHTLPTEFPHDELKDLWKETSSSSKWSNLYLADSIDVKLRAIGHNRASIVDATISEEQVDQLAYAEHNRWNMEKLLLGYRPLAESEKHLSDEEKKLRKKNMYVHHLIKPYAELDDAEKKLDRNIIKELPLIIKMTC